MTRSSILRRLVLGEMVLSGLAAVAVAVLARRHGWAALAAEGARASGLVAFVLLLVAASALAPAMQRAWRRVRGPAFRASLSRYAGLPRWYVAPAAFVGSIAAEARGLARAWADAEARTSSGCFAAGVLVAPLAAAGVGTDGWLAPAAALGAAAGLVALHAYQFSYATEKPITCAL